MITRYHGPNAPQIIQNIRTELDQLALNDQQAGEPVSEFELVFFDGTFLRQARPNDPDRMPVAGMMEDDLTSGQLGDVFIRGIISNAVWAFASGGTLFAGSGGQIIQTAPSASGEIVQRMGRAMTITQIHFNPEDNTIQIGE